jgi:phage tail-like protein
MTQAISRPKLRVSLDPQKPLEVSTSASFSFETPETPTAKGLLLEPGKPGKILLKISNSGIYPLQWRFKIEGNLPESTIIWCDKPNFPEIKPHNNFDAKLYFQVPNDFFEKQDALESQQKALEINYHIEVSVYAVNRTRVNIAESIFWHRIFWQKWYRPEINIQSTEAEAENINLEVLFWTYVYIYELNNPIFRYPQEYRFFDVFVRPEISYLNFLPAIYGEVDFLGRFLSILEQAFDPTVQTDDTLWAYLDPLTAPESFLPFLAHWVGWELDPRWSIDAQRRLIRNAIELYRWHGTKRGLHTYLHLYTGLPEERINIQEDFKQGFVLGNNQIGTDSVLGGGRPYHFIVELRPEEPNQINEQLVREVIEEQKPAFSTYELLMANN